MRFSGTSGERYGELLAKVEREKMRSAGLEVERDSLMRCCNELQEDLEQSRQREAAKDAVLGRVKERNSDQGCDCIMPLDCKWCYTKSRDIDSILADVPEVLDERGSDEVASWVGG